jgi:hypothetical protein
VSPGSACKICEPDRAADGWSDREGTCDDGSFCTVDDACHEGSCTGTSRVCDDGVVCNGTSSCDDVGLRCTPDENQCGAGEVCNVASDSCGSTCEGCSIDGVCVQAGAERTGNPCLVCQPEQSTSAYTALPGKPCGVGATDCSGADTCDAEGTCQPNHFLVDSACGNPASNDCDQADSCDGSGNCLPRFADNGTPCEDGFFCTTADNCQGGSCLAATETICPPAQLCNETADQCQCPNAGCVVDGSCVPSGATNDNGCLICDPARSSIGFSPNTNARCGADATSCSAADTCDDAGNCLTNHVEAGIACRAASDCSAAASCDGNGVCPFIPTDGTGCDDGIACTRPDRCQAGRCVSGPRIATCIEP